MTAAKAHVGGVVAALCQLGQYFYPHPEVWAPAAVILTWLAVYLVPNSEV